MAIGVPVMVTWRSLVLSIWLPILIWAPDTCRISFILVPWRPMIEPISCGEDERERIIIRDIYCSVMSFSKWGLFYLSAIHLCLFHQMFINLSVSYIFGVELQLNAFQSVFKDQEETESLGCRCLNYGCLACTALCSMGCFILLHRCGWLHFQPQNSFSSVYYVS